MIRKQVAAGPRGRAAGRKQTQEPPDVGLLHRVLDPDHIPDNEAHQQADEAGGGHVGKGAVRKIQDHTHDDHDGGNDGRPEFPICQKILHNTLFLGVIESVSAFWGASRTG